MIPRNLKTMLVLAVGLVSICHVGVWADRLELQARLSKDVKTQLSDVTIVEALEKIGKQAGVEFVLSDEAVWKLPQGEATRLSVTLQGPLAQSMPDMLNSFFMRYAVGDREITIYPRPELEHIIGRPTAAQLELLSAIYTQPVVVYDGTVQATINGALGRYVAVVPHEALREIDRLLYRLAGVTPDPRFGRGGQRMVETDKVTPHHPQFDLPGPMAVANMLEEVSGPGSEWYLSGTEFPNQIPEIRVVDVFYFRQAKLDQIVDISFKDEPAETIIQRLAKWTGMQLNLFKEDPGWLKESISVDMQNIKLRQAILNIVSTVDGEVSIDVKDNEIEMQGPIRREKPEREKTPKSATGDYVGKISIPMEGGEYYIEFMLRESDLTEELKKLRQEKMREILGESAK